MEKTSDAAIWQEVEFGSYAADLPLWVELAGAAAGPVLELGAGAGRVSLHLAERGHQVIAVESDAMLAAELEPSARRCGGRVWVLRADLASPASLGLPAVPVLAIGPLHVVQLFEEATRLALLARLRELVAPGGRVALTVVDEPTLLSAPTSSGQILPDMRELDGWVYSSQPLWVLVGDDTLSVRRIRERVSPDGALERTIHDELLQRLSPERLEVEAEEAGFRAAGRRRVSSGDREADSIAVLAEVPR